jgi:death-on-curing protein
MNKLNKEQILLLHQELIVEFGGSNGIRDEELLDAALQAPFQSFGGESLYPTLQAKAARLCFGIVQNHPFIDGNKRIGAHVMIIFLAINGIELSYSQDELVGIILDVASGKSDSNMVLDWILSHLS